MQIVSTAYVCNFVITSINITLKAQSRVQISRFKILLAMIELMANELN